MLYCAVNHLVMELRNISFKLGYLKDSNAAAHSVVTGWLVRQWDWDGRTRTRHLRLEATTPNHYSAEADYVICSKSLSFYSFSMKLPPARWSPAASTELLTVKKQCKRIFHGNEWMKEHNYAFQNADTRPRLQNRTQNICFFISISAVILKRMSKSHPFSAHTVS